MTSSGSPNTLIASGKLTPCLTRFVAAFVASHSNSTHQGYRTPLPAVVSLCTALESLATLHSGPGRLAVAPAMSKARRESLEHTRGAQIRAKLSLGA